MYPSVRLVRSESGRNNHLVDDGTSVVAHKVKRIPRFYFKIGIECPLVPVPGSIEHDNLPRGDFRVDVPGRNQVFFHIPCVVGQVATADVDCSVRTVEQLYPPVPVAVTVHEARLVVDKHFVDQHFIQVLL